MAMLNKRVWGNNNLTVNIKLKVYQTCFLSTLLYDCESWATHISQEKHLASLQLCCLRGITWQDKYTNTKVLEKAGSLIMHLMLCMWRLRWLGYVYRMDDGRIPKDLLYMTLPNGSLNSVLQGHLQT